MRECILLHVSAFWLFEEKPLRLSTLNHFSSEGFESHILRVAFPIQVLGNPCKYRYYLEMDTLFRMGSDHLRTKGFTCSTHIFLCATWDCIYILGTIILFVLANKKGDFFKKVASFIKGLIWVSLLSLAQNELIWLWTFYFPWCLFIKNMEALGNSENVSLLESMLSVATEAWALQTLK